MYAIVEIAGQQFKVEKDQKIFVHRLEQKEGEKVEFSDVYLIDDGKDIKIGKPTIRDAKVTAKVTKDDVRGDKVKVFKKKRRKGYQKQTGHRQNFSEIEIQSISLKKTTTKNAETKVESKPKTEAKAKPKTEAKAKTETKAKVETKPKTVKKAKTETKTKK